MSTGFCNCVELRQKVRELEDQLALYKRVAERLEDLINAQEYRSQARFYNMRPEIVEDVWDNARRALDALPEDSHDTKA